MSLVGFPLLLIPLAIINIIVFLMPGVSLGAPLGTVVLLSGASWKVSLSDALLALSLVLILFEVLKAARPQGRYVTDHLLAFLVLAGTVAEFLLLPQFANSVVLLLAVMMAVDFLAGAFLRVQRPAAVPASPPVGLDSQFEPVVPPLVAPTPSEPAPTPAAATTVAPIAAPPLTEPPSQAPASEAKDSVR